MNSTEAKRERLYAVVEGRVQGVGFRYYVRENANALELTGWVRNRWDESVEFLAEGERNKLERLLAFAQRGPKAAFVSEIKYEWQTATGEFTAFRVMPTA